MLSDGSIDQMNYWIHKTTLEQFITEVRLKIICEI